MNKKEKSDKEKNYYIDDNILTKQLLREQKEFHENKRKSASNELAKEFLLTLDHTLRKRNFVGYTENWKVEFRSKAHYLFVRHWYKFDPKKSRLNYFQKSGELFFKENEEDWRGGFNWFSLLCNTAARDEIKKFKRIQEKNQEIIETKNNELKNYHPSLYKG